MAMKKLAVQALCYALTLVLTVRAGDAIAAEFSAEATALPYPPDARELEFTAWAGDIDYQSQSSLKSLADFYLKEMAKRGWEHDEEEVDIEDDSIELTFKHGEAEVELDLRQWSKEVRVSLDCKNVKFTDTDNPAKLVAVGIPMPQATLYLQKEIALPASVEQQRYDGDGYTLLSKMELQEAFDHFTGQVKSKGFRESRRPIITDTRRYSEFKKGPIEVSVNVFTHDVGSRSVLEYTNDRPEKPVPPLPAVASLSIRNPGEPESEDLAEAPVAKTPINVATNKGQAIVTYGGKKYTFPHVACFQTKDRGDYATEVVYASKPIPYNKMQAMVAAEDDFYFGSMYEFDMPDYFMMQLGKYRNLSFSADGIGIGGYDIDNPTGEMKIEDGRVTGTMQMPPKEILNRQMSFTATINAAIITPNTRFSTGTKDPVEKPHDPVLADSPVPMPPGAEDIGRQGSNFRMTYSAVVAMPVGEVASFYQKELAAQGLKKVSDSAGGEAMEFENSELAMSVALKRKGSETAIEVVVRQVAIAKREGILPEPGKGRLVLANAHTVGVVFTIGKTDYPLKAGQGAEDFKKALSYSIPPGTYKVVIKIPGEQPKTERIKLTEGSTWAIIALPTGGYMPMQMY